MSATAKYGQKGKNGVILITTRKKWINVLAFYWRARTEKTNNVIFSFKRGCFERQPFFIFSHFALRNQPFSRHLHNITLGIKPIIMKRTILITACLLLSFFFPLQAQIFEYINMENGLSSRRVLSIQQDKQNYMWILTHKGLDRYNGKQFKHYQLNHHKSPLSFYPNLNFLYTDKENNIWEANKDGLIIRYNEQKDSFQNDIDFKAEYSQL